MGPFVDATDGSTAETALTIAQADIRLSKNGGAFAQSNNAAGATHGEAGYYLVPLDATDTATIGRLRVAVSEAGALPVWEDYAILDEAVYDVLFGTVAPSTLTAAQVNTEVDTAISDVGLTTTITGRIDVASSTLATAASLATTDAVADAIKVKTDQLVFTVANQLDVNVMGFDDTLGNDTLVADIATEVWASTRPVGRSAATIVSGTASGTPTTTTMTAAVSIVPTVADQFKGRILIFADNTTTTALRGQATDITASTAPGAGNVGLTFTALTTAPVSGDTFVIT
jgi:hypothetical protein